MLIRHSNRTHPFEGKAKTVQMSDGTRHLRVVPGVSTLVGRKSKSLEWKPRRGLGGDVPRCGDVQPNPGPRQPVHATVAQICDHTSPHADEHHIAQTLQVATANVCGLGDLFSQSSRII